MIHILDITIWDDKLAQKVQYKRVLRSTSKEVFERYIEFIKSVYNTPNVYCFYTENPKGVNSSKEWQYKLKHDEPHK